MKKLTFLLFISVSLLAVLLYKILDFLQNTEAPTYYPVKIPMQYFNGFKDLKFEVPVSNSITTLSASHLRDINIYAVILISILVTLYFRVKKFISIKESFILILIVTFGNLFLLFQVDDLVDEAYVWIEKIQNLIQFGHFGVALSDGTYAESSVGTLHFLVSALFQVLGFTPEQSLFLPLYLSFSLSQILIFKLIIIFVRSTLVATLFILGVYVSPVIGLNFSNAFDNVLAFSFLIFWVFLELCCDDRGAYIRKYRLMFVFLFPLVRLDYTIISMGIIALHIIENRIFSPKKFFSEIKSCKKEVALLVLAFTSWLIYKLWAFGDLIPAMASFKGLHYSPYLWKTGILELYKTLNLEKLTQIGWILLIPVFLFLVTYRKNIFNKIFNPKKNLFYNFLSRANKIHYLFILNLIFILIVFTLTVISGGDYFGIGYVRYQFPFLLLQFLLMLIIFLRIQKSTTHWIANSKVVWFNLFTFFSISIGLIFFRPEQIKGVVTDVKTVEAGRATCDAGAALTIKSLFPNLQTVASPELNGFGYHAGLNLVDLVGLVDANVDRDKYIGTSGAKFRIIPSEAELEKTDVVWLFPASECTIDSTWVSDLGEINNSKEYKSKRLAGLVNSWAGTLRVVNFNEYIVRELNPYVIYFSFETEGTKRYGQAYVFLKSKS